jgi:hypothetical protein
VNQVWRPTSRAVATVAVQTVELPSGEAIPVLGLGAWHMAYSPIEQGRLAGHPALTAIAPRHGATAAQIDEEDLAALDRAFPPPTGPRPLEVL